MRAWTIVPSRNSFYSLRNSVYPLRRFDGYLDPETFRSVTAVAVAFLSLVGVALGSSKKVMHERDDV